MTATTTQKADAAPIGFRLEPASGAAVSFTLPIRPEDLNYSEPAMQTPAATFGGAFVDDFGRGIQSISISGTTGWGQGTRPDGAEQFKRLYDTVWVRWHAERESALSRGQDPNDVRLIFVDALNDRVVTVMPGLFVLKRNKTRPLLAMYQINMIVTDTGVVPSQDDPLSIGSSSSSFGVLSGLASLKASVGKIEAAVSNARGFIDATIAQPVRAFMGMTHEVMTGVSGLVDGVKGVVGAEAAQLAGVGADLALAGRNAFQAYNAVANAPDFLRAEVSAVAANYQNAFCILKNSFRKVEEYPDYSGLYGAFNCSSTVGGSPLSIYADTNPWEVLAPKIPGVAAITQDAREQIDLLKRGDPVLSPMSLSEIGARLGVIAGGVQVTL
jgi:hypothetical protein